MQRGCAGPAPRGELGPTCATGYEENRHRERHRAAAQGENARQGCGVEGDEATGGRRGRQQAWARAAGGEHCSGPLRARSRAQVKKRVPPASPMSPSACITLCRARTAASSARPALDSFFASSCDGKQVFRTGAAAWERK